MPASIVGRKVTTLCGARHRRKSIAITVADGESQSLIAPVVDELMNVEELINLVERYGHQRDLARTDSLQADDQGSRQELEHRLTGDVMLASLKDQPHRGSLYQRRRLLCFHWPSSVIKPTPPAASSSWRLQGNASSLPAPTSTDAKAVRLAMTLIEGTRTLSPEAREAIFRSIYGINRQPR
ncbi:hypothetical protein TKK_0011568 [Trichogramma kaykai]|uniref:Transposase n=1 Tax=Trichogramma kaykai TaxID=54128 RepID=A0ABD2WQP4_9HYME